MKNSRYLLFISLMSPPIINGNYAQIIAFNNGKIYALSKDKNSNWDLAERDRSIIGYIEKNSRHYVPIENRVPEIGDKLVTYSKETQLIETTYPIEYLRKITSISEMPIGSIWLNKRAIEEFFIDNQ
ncbi:MAG: hypothetical protein QXJ28_01445 [Candidatus Pacearchaeota archaeon]